MSFFQKLFLFSTRVIMGWMFFYAGYTKLVDPKWSAEGYIKGAKTFHGFYQMLLSPSLLPAINFMNEWGLTLLGVSLVLGVGVRLSSYCGVLLLALYYLAILQFPYPNPHAYIVDEHIIYISALLLLASMKAGRVWGLETWCSKLPICRRFPRLREWLG
ncbi:MAG: DoxX family membrane protein [Parcubacteria group bacterium]|nr:DoxX family membrane protein [Parcubacteria group bacterium]